LNKDEKEKEGDILKSSNKIHLFVNSK